MQENFLKYLKGFSNWVNFTQNESETFDGLSTNAKESFSIINGVNFFKEPQLSALNEDICFGQNLNHRYRKNTGHLILTHININSICYKFDQLVDGLKERLMFLWWQRLN